MEQENSVNGVLCVIKSNSSLESISNYIHNLNVGIMGTLTTIYSKGIPTNNCITLVSRDLYHKIKEISENEHIQSISPYLITDKQIPRGEQTKDIFMRFEHLHNEIIDNAKLLAQIRCIINQLITFGLIDDINYEVNVGNGKPLIGTVKFHKDTTLDIAIYTRSLLNGHITTSGYKMKITAYWCSTPP